MDPIKKSKSDSDLNITSKNGMFKRSNSMPIPDREIIFQNIDKDPSYYSLAALRRFNLTDKEITLLKEKYSIYLESSPKQHK